MKTEAFLELRWLIWSRGNETIEGIYTVRCGDSTGLSLAAVRFQNRVLIITFWFYENVKILWFFQSIFLVMAGLICESLAVSAASMRVRAMQYQPDRIAFSYSFDHFLILWSLWFFMILVNASSSDVGPHFWVSGCFGRRVLRTPPDPRLWKTWKGASSSYSWCEALFAIGQKAKRGGPKVDSNNGYLFGAYVPHMKPKARSNWSISNSNMRRLHWT